MCMSVCSGMYAHVNVTCVYVHCVYSDVFMCVYVYDACMCTCIHVCMCTPMWVHVCSTAFTQSFADGHSTCFDILPIMNFYAINMGRHMCV